MPELLQAHVKLGYLRQYTGKNCDQHQQTGGWQLHQHERGVDQSRERQRAADAVGRLRAASDQIEADLLFSQIGDDVADVAAADLLLREAGYVRTKPDFELTAFQWRKYLEVEHELNHFHPQTGITVELQWRFEGLPDIAFDVERHKHLGGLAAEARRRMTTMSHRPSVGLALFQDSAYLFRLQGSWRARFPLVRRALSSPQNWKEFPLADKWFWLYYPASPLLWAWRRLRLRSPANIENRQPGRPRTR
jgi:hypothetical protein